jgi:ribose transport system permease protein
MTQPIPSRPTLLRFRGAKLSGPLSLLAIIIAFWIIFSIKSSGFLSPFNLFAVGRSLAIDVMIGFSQMVVLATGGMNLAVGSIGVCAVMFSGALMQFAGVPVPIAIAAALMLGAGLGWLNGFTIVRTGLNSFVITLASANLYSGAMLILTKAEPYNQLPPGLGAFGRLRIVGVISPFLLVAVAIGLALFVLYRYSLFGRYVLSAGANPRAAAMSGVPVPRAVITSHMLSGVLAAIAGMMVVAKVGAAMPAVGGEEWLLPSFLGPVVGGTLLAGGAVSVIGTFLGAALVTTIRSGLLVMGIGNFWLQLFLGMALLAAVLIERYRAVYAERRALVSS